MDNIALIVLDSVRKDYFDTTATKLFEQADVTFDQARSTSTWTVPTHASMFSGRLPSEHGIHSHNVDFAGLDNGDNVFELLEEYHTIGITANKYLGSDFGFAEHFDSYFELDRGKLYQDGLDVRTRLKTGDASGVGRYIDILRETARHEHPLKSLFNGAETKLDPWFRRAGIGSLHDDGARGVRSVLERELDSIPEPYFLFINFMDAHTPHYPRFWYDNDIHGLSLEWRNELNIHAYNAKSDTGTQKQAIRELRRLYRAEIAYLDETVHGIIDDLTADSSAKTSVIVTSDHGENLGFSHEDRMIGHVGSLSEGILHVPLLLVNPPDGVESDSDQMVSLAQLPELIRGIIDQESPNLSDPPIRAELIGIQNRSLVRGENPLYDDHMLRAVYMDDEKFLWDQTDRTMRYQLLPEIPNFQVYQETIDALPQELRGTFETELQEYANRVKSAEHNDPKLDDKLQSRLKDLGYL